MFLSRNKKSNVVYTCKPQFYYIKMVFKGGANLYRYVFLMKISETNNTIEVLNSYPSEFLDFNRFKMKMRLNYSLLVCFHRYHRFNILPHI